MVLCVVLLLNIAADNSLHKVTGFICRAKLHYLQPVLEESNGDNIIATKKSSSLATGCGPVMQT